MDSDKIRRVETAVMAAAKGDKNALLALAHLIDERDKYKAALEDIAKDKDDGGAEGHYGQKAYEALKDIK